MLPVPNSILTFFGQLTSALSSIAVFHQNYPFNLRFAEHSWNWQALISVKQSIINNVRWQHPFPRFSSPTHRIRLEAQ